MKRSINVGVRISLVALSMVLCGMADSCRDRDGDGVQDTSDNCPDTPNPDQTDSNGNGVGDACEPRPTLTLQATGQGSVSLNPPGGTYDTGAQVTLTATADAGWSFDHWEGALTGSTNPATLTMDADKSVTAVFKQPDAVCQAIQAIIAEDPRLATATPLAAADYQALAERMAAVPGVESAQYIGDVLGSFQVEVTGGGLLTWRHIKNSFREASLLPANLVKQPMLDPTWNQGWGTPVGPLPSGASNLQGSESNTYATHFPMAIGNPDPEYAADDAVPCVQEGRIAIVDFQWTAGHDPDNPLYTDPSAFMVDGIMLYDRIKMMGEAANFTVDLYKDNEINLQNFDILNQYSIVIITAHGSPSPPKASRRLKALFTQFDIADKYEPAKPMLGGVSEEEGWKRGYFTYDPDDKSVSVTSFFFRDVYRPRPDVPQMWMVNTCFGMQPYRVTTESSATGVLTVVPDLNGPVYNVGHGLMKAGAQVVFGYPTWSNPAPIQNFTMSFFRRLFGGYFKDDEPPSPHVYWPTCMSAQTFFRDPANPFVAKYCPKEFQNQEGTFLYTMYAVDEPQYFRKVCTENHNAHLLLQSFMLNVGTPATAFGWCWDQWWQAGNCPNFIQDSLCFKGECPTTDSACKDAACAVKIARKVTNAMLR